MNNGPFIKGLVLARTFFEEEALPRFKAQCPDLLPWMAAGLVGEGSDCFGYDDELSQDHDWGPGFSIWLSHGAHAVHGPRVRKAYDSLSLVFKDAGPRRVSMGNEHRTGVTTIDEFYCRLTGFSDTPERHLEWLLIPESALAACTNGALFHDPEGEFSARRERFLNFYPEDVRRKKIAARCMTIGQSGQYNFSRCLKRHEQVALQYAQTKFIADIISVVFLLNRRYTPFYKWMHRALKELPWEGAWFHERIGQLTAAHDDGLKPDMIETLCLKVINMLQGQELSDSKSHFLPDHGPLILSTIKDPALRNRNVWVG